MPHILQKISSVLLQSQFVDNPDQHCRVIVEMASPYSDRVAVYVEESEGKVHREMKYFPCVVVELPYSALDAIVMSPHVRKVWHDVKLKTLLDVAVPASGGTKAHDLGFTGKDVTIAVIDTGIFPHSDLIYPQNRIIGWHDLVNERPTPYDDNGHGTHVTGILAGNGTSSHGKYIGMAPEANIVGIKVLGQDGSGNSSDAISAIEWCIENQTAYNIKVINMSIGSKAQESAMEDPLCRAVYSAWQKNMVVCIAAGNDGPDPRTINTPGITPFAITVGNLDDKGTSDTVDDNISDSSSRGPTIDSIMKPDILAPGTNIMSLRVGGGYRSLSGTSMATPMVTGAVAQMYQKWPSLKPDQVKMMLARNARAMGFHSVQQGFGALNMETAFEESKKEESLKKNNLFDMLFGKNSIFENLLSQKLPVKPTDQRQKILPSKKSVDDVKTGAKDRQKDVTSNLMNLLPLAAIAILPMII